MTEIAINFILIIGSNSQDSSFGRHEYESYGNLASNIFVDIEE